MLAAALAVQPADPLPQHPVRIVDHPTLHVGARPHVDFGKGWWGFGLTLQFSTRAL